MEQVGRWGSKEIFVEGHRLLWWLIPALFASMSSIDLKREWVELHFHHVFQSSASCGQVWIWHCQPGCCVSIGITLQSASVRRLLKLLLSMLFRLFLHWVLVETWKLIQSNCTYFYFKPIHYFYFCDEVSIGWTNFTSFTKNILLILYVNTSELKTCFVFTLFGRLFCMYVCHTKSRSIHPLQSS